MDVERSYIFRVLRWCCPDDLYEGIEGDLIEQYVRNKKEFGSSKAKIKLFFGAARFVRPGIILRNKLSFRLINTDMIANYLITAYRNLLKNKSFSLINIFGLAIGLAACLLITQFVVFELSYDRFNEKFDRIYRVTNDRFQNGKLIQHGTITYPTIGPAMAKDYPEIEEYTRLAPWGDLNAKIGDKYFRGAERIYVDERFFSIFSYKLLAGERHNILKEPFTVVLTEQTARKYFEVKDDNFDSIIGETIYEGNDLQPYKVVGVCENVPGNSHLYFDALTSYATLYNGDDKSADDSWGWSDMRHYLVLRKGIDPKELEAKFEDFSQRYFQGDKVSGSVEKFYLQPLDRAHLYSDFEYDVARTASGKAVWAMLIVAGFILLIAWINYINLTTSRAIDRAKEVGLRKVMGAAKRQLVSQFIFESLLVTVLAFAVAVVLVLALQSSFNQIIRNDLSITKIFALIESKYIIGFVLLLIAGAILSGFYPAFVLSGYQPVTVLKGKFQRSYSGQFLRRALVVFQFVASTALITSTLIVADQLSFMNRADLGMSIRDVVVVQPPELMSWDSTFISRLENYRNDVNKINGVVSATTSWRTPGRRLGRSFGIRLADQSSETHYTMSHLGVDWNFFNTYHIEVLAGRSFQPEDHNATWQNVRRIVINESAVKLLGLSSPEEAVGRELIWFGDRKWTIIGVVNDFHQESLKKPMEAMIFPPAYDINSDISIRIETANFPETIRSLEEVYKKFFPGNPFEYSFLENNYNNQYNDDKRFGKIISVFTGLAIVVSCLGLIGLSSYTAFQRTKEVGIRKVLGASVANIVSILSLDFVRLIIIAAILALPIAYFAMDYWLQEYAYRITPGVVSFLLPTVVVIVIAGLTISLQILGAARSNPADTLKYE